MMLLDAAAQDSLKRHLADWEDSTAGCVDWVCAARGIATERVTLAHRSGSRPRSWLRFEVGANAYLYGRSQLLAPAGDPGVGAWRHINGDLPALTVNKYRTKKRIAEHGLPVPGGRFFRSEDLEGAIAWFDKASRPICVKPNRGHGGSAVFTWIENRQDFEQAFRAVAADYASVLVEDDIEGESLRFFYVEPRVLQARINRPACVTGDGTSSIAALVDARNMARKARGLPGHPPIVVDDDVRRYLRLSGLLLSDILPEGATIRLRGACSIGFGGEAVVAGDIHPSYSRQIETMLQAFRGLHVAAVDAVVADRREPARPGNYRVLEINSSPDVVRYYFPWEGAACDVVGAVLDRLESGAWEATGTATPRVHHDPPREQPRFFTRMIGRRHRSRRENGG